jgi:hypothetical protein
MIGLGRIIEKRAFLTNSDWNCAANELIVLADRHNP